MGVFNYFYIDRPDVRAFQVISDLRRRDHRYSWDGESLPNKQRGYLSWCGIRLGYMEFLDHEDEQFVEDLESAISRADRDRVSEAIVERLKNTRVIGVLQPESNEDPLRLDLHSLYGALVSYDGSGAYDPSMVRKGSAIPIAIGTFVLFVLGLLINAMWKRVR